MAAPLRCRHTSLGCSSSSSTRVCDSCPTGSQSSAPPPPPPPRSNVLGTDSIIDCTGIPSFRLDLRIRSSPRDHDGPHLDQTPACWLFLLGFGLLGGFLCCFLVDGGYGPHFARFYIVFPYGPKNIKHTQQGMHCRQGQNRFGSNTMNKQPAVLLTVFVTP